MERLARDKHSSLLQTFVNYGKGKSYNIGPSSNITLHSEEIEIFENLVKISGTDNKNLVIEGFGYDAEKSWWNSHIKFFFSSLLMMRPNKLKGLPLETCSSQVLEFEGKA